MIKTKAILFYVPKKKDFTSFNSIASNAIVDTNAMIASSIKQLENGRDAQLVLDKLSTDSLASFLDTLTNKKIKAQNEKLFEKDMLFLNQRLNEVAYKSVLEKTHIALSERYFGKGVSVTREKWSEYATTTLSSTFDLAIEYSSNPETQINFMIERLQAIAKGESIDSVKKRSFYQAREATREFFTQAHIEEMRELEVEEFIWIASNDARTRPEHASWDGLTFPLETDSPEKFGSSEFPWTGEKAGEAWGCRCSERPLVPIQFLQ